MSKAKVWPPAEWVETDAELDELHSEYLTTVTDGVEATWEGDHVHLSMVLHKDVVAEYINWEARYEDHDCSDGADELWELLDRIIGAWKATTAYEGDIVGDHCDDDEQDGGRGVRLDA